MYKEVIRTLGQYIQNVAQPTSPTLHFCKVFFYLFGHIMCACVEHPQK